MNRRKRKGFTFIEILVVTIIIAMLAAFVVPRIGDKFGRAKVNIARAKMGFIENALIEFQINCGRFPTDSENLDALLTPPSDLEEKWGDRPYLKQSDLLDPWGNPYIYVSEGEVNIGSFDLISYGADGAEGGEGENADIVND